MTTYINGSFEEMMYLKGYEDDMALNRYIYGLLGNVTKLMDPLKNPLERSTAFFRGATQSIIDMNDRMYIDEPVSLGDTYRVILGIELLLYNNFRDVSKEMRACNHMNSMLLSTCVLKDWFALMNETDFELITKAA